MPFPASFAQEQAEKFQSLIDGDPEYIDRWLKRWVATNGPRRFLARAVGAAANRKLHAALEADCRVIFNALQRGVDALLPLAQAVDSCGQFANTDDALQLLHAFKPDADSAQSSIFVLLGLNLSDVLQKIGALRVEDLLAGEFSGIHFSFSESDVKSTVDRLAEVVSSDSRERISALNERLVRKIQGAGDALDNSADGVSQAANSLVEFVDRLLRAVAFDEETVQWLSASQTLTKEATYISGGKTRPTKRGQALYFISGHKPVGDVETDPVSSYIISGLLGARDALQKFKHADEGSDEEKDIVRKAARAIEGFVVFTLRVGWLGRTDSELDLLRMRVAGI